jgi:type VI secretion system secreted protein Hcp
MPSNIFAKLEAIKGESLDSKHKDEIDVLSFSWGLVNTAPPAGGGGGASGKPTFHDIAFVHNIDRASPLLMKACATGTHIKTATLTSRKAGKQQHEYMIFKFYDLLITGVALGGAAGQPETGAETVTMSFAKMEFQYTLQKADGTAGGNVAFRYDLKTNKTF